MKHKKLVETFWTFFDDDLSGRITKFELVQAIAPLTRGRLEDVARMFFRFYDSEKVSFGERGPLLKDATTSKRFAL